MIPVYKAEIESGIAELITKPDNMCLAYAAPIMGYTDGASQYIDITNKTRSLCELSLATNLNQFDLYYLYTILVTTGWNKNDDVFDPIETWKARFTPEDKPFNLEHKPDKIIGHITANYVVNDEYKIIPNDTAVDDLPPLFHLLTSSVIYKHLQSRNKDLQEETAALIEEIKEGKWYVSMECLFTDFNYAFASEAGDKIIQRGPDTAFLTKHLRAYGGTGLYENKKIGRVMKNIAYSGKGLVRKPANENSIIFTNVEKFKGIFASLTDLSVIKDETSLITAEVLKMNEVENKTITDLQAKLVEAEAKIRGINESALKEEIASLKNSVAERDAKIEASVTQMTKTNDEKAKLEKDFAEAQAKIVTLNEGLAKLQVENLKASRITTLVDKGVDKVEAEKLVVAFISVDETQFNTLVDLQAKLVAKNETSVVTPTPEATEGKKKDEEEEEDKNESNASTKVLDSAKADETPDMNISTDKTSASVDELCVAVAEFLKPGKTVQE